ncbi:MAG TPA: hypothetical protein VEJ63_07420 [Planctomycetota bacterium]|nr:hypothetical protein [Planctomycetota bacterium]
MAVANVEQLRAAINSVKDGETISIADGTYQLVPYVWLRNKKNVAIRGASGDPTKVILRGKGWDQGGDHDDEDIMWLEACENITIADITFTEVHAYGLKVNPVGNPKNINVYNCHFKNIGIRGIKGTRSDPQCKLWGGSVRYCFFENTKIPPKNWQADGDYITSIDMMALDGWTFSDNVFKDIKGANEQARGAVFVWVDSANVVVERNVFVNCDRGVCFGNASNPGGVVHLKNGVCRNNMFVTTSVDAMVEISWSENVKVYHNTILKRKPNTRGIRVINGTNCKDVEIANNLNGGGFELSGAKEINNYTGAMTDYFVYPEHGNLRLTPAAVAAINKGQPIPDVKEDYDGGARDAQPDLGASEFGAKAPSSLPGIASSSGSSGSSSASSSGKSDAQFTAGARPKTDAPKDAKPETTKVAAAPAAPKAAIDPKPYREAIMKALQDAGTKTGTKIHVSVFGRKQDAPFRGADASGIKIDVQGNTMPLAWRDLSDAELVHIGTTTRPDDGETLFQAAALAAAAGLDAQYEKLCERLFEKDAERAKKLVQLRK